MPRRKRASRTERISESRTKGSEAAYRFKLFGVTLVLRPPRMIDLGKALAGSIPAIAGVASTLIAAADHRSTDSAALRMERYRLEMSNLAATDSRTKARIVFERLSNSAGTDAEVRNRYIDFLESTGDRGRAMAILGSLARDGFRSDPRYHFRLANLLLSEPSPTEGQLLEAERHLRRTIELDTGQYAVLARRKIALIEVRRGELTAAVRTLEPVMTESPVAGAEALWLAWSGNEAFDPNAVARVLDRLERDLRSQRIADPETVLGKIRILVMTGRVTEAAEWLALQKSLAAEVRATIETEFAEMQLVASMKNSTEGNLPDWSKLENVLKRKPDDPIWLKLAVTIWAGPRRVGSEPARAWVQSRLDDGSASDFLLREALVSLSGQYEEFGRSAADSKLLRMLYRQFLKRFPADAVAMNNLAVLMYKHEPENLEEALRLAREADGLVPDQVAIQETIGQTLARLGRFDEARPILEKCLGPLPGEWGLHNTLSQIYEKTGERVLARAHREILANLPRPPDADSFERLQVPAGPFAPMAER